MLRSTPVALLSLAFALSACTTAAGRVEPGATAATDDGFAEARAAAAAVNERFCASTALPRKFRQTGDSAYYEVRCNDGRIFHAVCTDGTCRERTAQH